MIKIKRKKNVILYLQKTKRLSGSGAEAMLHLAAYGFAAVEQRRSRNHRCLAAFFGNFLSLKKESYPSETGHAIGTAGSA